MVKNRIFSVLVVCAALSLGPICDGGVSEEVACENVCECAYFFPSDQRACVAQCLPELEVVAQECIDCIAYSECRELEDDGCADVCSFLWQEIEVSDDHR